MRGKWFIYALEIMHKNEGELMFDLIHKHIYDLSQVAKYFESRYTLMRNPFQPWFKSWTMWFNSRLKYDSGHEKFESNQTRLKEEHEISSLHDSTWNLWIKSLWFESSVN